MTLAGCRPEWIRLSLIIPKLDKLVEHVLIDTGQNYDHNLSGIFRDELGIREPDYTLEVTGSFGIQLTKLMWRLEEILIEEKPDAFLVLGDTNSSMGAIIAKRLGIRVFHMEAGNRCYDDRVPEETNRRIIDHSSDILMPYTERSRANLLMEGIEGQRVYVTGNPIYEVLEKFTPGYEEPKDFYLVTLHRSENVDNPKRLQTFVDAFNLLDKPVIWPIHPHTKNQLDNNIRSNVTLLPPLGLLEFIKLEKQAYCVLSDSGTVQEECCIFGTPNVTLRDSTERPETLETGSNFIAGCDVEAIFRGVSAVTRLSMGRRPPEYDVTDVSDTVVKILLSYWR